MKSLGRAVLFAFMIIGLNYPIHARGLKSSLRIKNVVIVGNSIVIHAPNKELGWFGNWGMAASSVNKDFVHILMSKIHQLDTAVNIRFLNIASFERDYEGYDFSQLNSYRNADLLIVKISENVDHQSYIERNFYYHYDKLIHYLAPTNLTVKVLVDGFWPTPVNEMIEKYAKEKNDSFVSIRDLYNADISNSARGLFENEGVANHPSDIGMKAIAERIWDRISQYFKN